MISVPEIARSLLAPGVCMPGGDRPMVTHILCSECEVELVHHCQRCEWYDCPNGDCPAKRYDLDHERVLMYDGRVESYGD